MLNRIALILLAVTLSSPVFGEQTGAVDQQPAKRSHHHHTKAAIRPPPKNDAIPAEERSQSAIDTTKNGTVGAAGGIVRPPAPVDPEVHKLNAALPP